MGFFCFSVNTNDLYAVRIVITFFYHCFLSFGEETWPGGKERWGETRQLSLFIGRWDHDMEYFFDIQHYDFIDFV
ncbi:MAG: hypothetical protein GW939_03865 [Candidatus Magasanikbacteria bacterium]|uniref:Uncharacterized protein n=1 Tax=Candidatus Magasanikbacteria bacterium CG10_big_fil_rev_8_21_14_0_10_38_6 TaxID=1974647 RepID=A0A2M6P076_9BACT|nr:hypothetical protein [Candidatus Magasanikbacteria bacterium]PIR77101.1 MAG: hypothetical protein COU30_04310 [Candidatus Magasanikbacteria bacterium CG10_big_fil_rev_8_21_14_0_10_38_6]